MEVLEYIQVGMIGEGEFLVEEEYSADYVGSGSLDVLATPSLIAFMERIAHNLLEQHLPEGYSSVGILVEVQHVAPTPVGVKVRVQCKVVELNDRRITFEVQAWDENGEVGVGRHQRMVIEVNRFLQHLRVR